MGIVAPMRRVALSVVLLAGCKGESEETPAPVEAPPAIAWVDIDTNAGLADAAAEAAAAGKGLMLDVRADWCVPCKELERDTFSQAAVRKALHDRFVAARLDVTDPSPDAEALQRRVGGAAMPWVVVWSMTAEDTKAFADGAVPPPAKTVSTYVSAEEFLAILP